MKFIFKLKDVNYPGTNIYYYLRKHKIFYFDKNELIKKILTHYLHKYTVFLKNFLT